jgi:hypothetical protein
MGSNVSRLTKPNVKYSVISIAITADEYVSESSKSSRPDPQTGRPSISNRPAPEEGPSRIISVIIRLRTCLLSHLPHLPTGYIKMTNMGKMGVAHKKEIRWAFMS